MKHSKETRGKRNSSVVKGIVLGLEQLNLVMESVEQDKRITRETRAGWPLLTVEIEVNGDSKSTNERGPSFLGWFAGLDVPGTRDFVLPWLL
jgi:hypothetical protein